MHRKKNRLARKAELARASRKRKKAYLGELEDEVRRLTVRIAQVEAVRFGQAMDAAAASDQAQQRRNESVSSTNSSLSPLSSMSPAGAAQNNTRPHPVAIATSPTGLVAESPHELHLEKLRIVEQLEVSPPHGQQHQQPQQPQQPASAPPLSTSPALLVSPSSDSASAASIVSSLPRVQSDSNLSLSSSVSSVDASMDSLPPTAATSSFACTVGELVGRSQYFLTAIRHNFCPGDQEKFALFGFQQAAEIHAQQQNGNEPTVGGTGEAATEQNEETTMADDSEAQPTRSTSATEPSTQSTAESNAAVESALPATGSAALLDARAQLSAASASIAASPTSQSPSSPSGLSPASASPLASSVSALHTFWLTLLRSELAVDENQLEQLKRMRDTMAPFTTQLRALESRMAATQPAVLSHQQRMLEVRRRVRAVMSDEQFERLQRWLDKNDWVDHMLTSQIPALAFAQQQHNNAAQHHGSGSQQHGTAGTGMPRTASGTRLSAAAANSSKGGGGGGGGGSDDDDDDDDDDDVDSDDEADEAVGAGGLPARNSLHSRSMSIAEEKEEND